jgi:hypothetical protein
LPEAKGQIIVPAGLEQSKRALQMLVQISAQTLADCPKARSVSIDERRRPGTSDVRGHSLSRVAELIVFAMSGSFRDHATVYRGSLTTVRRFPLLAW